MWKRRERTSRDRAAPAAEVRRPDTLPSGRKIGTDVDNVGHALHLVFRLSMAGIERRGDGCGPGMQDFDIYVENRHSLGQYGFRLGQERHQEMHTVHLF